jgi:hypothetical protein
MLVMTGIYLIAMTGGWLWLVLRLTKKMRDRLPKVWWGKWLQVLLVAVLMPLPLIDEIVGGRQFAALCEKNVVKVNAGSARGRTVYLEYAVDLPVKGTWVPVWVLPYRYLDLTTGELVVSYDHLRAEGGVLFPGFDSGPDPLTFNGKCKPPGVFDRDFFSRLGITEVKRPTPDPSVLR